MLALPSYSFFRLFRVLCWALWTVVFTGGCGGQNFEHKDLHMKGSDMKLRDGAFDLPDLATLPADGGKEFNRLVFTSSPYLLQHARNPVDWYPWGDEAFAEARREDKPIFLSIGYSTCHWCHVMEHESFEDAEVAAFLNAHFVAIKVDREERPDIDQIYMTVCQAMTGSGGWPLSIFMTPDKQPFYAGTYFPKEDRFGRPGFIRLMHSLNEAWGNDRKKVLSVGSQINAQLLRAMGGKQGQLQPDILMQAERQFAHSYDEVFGGFGQAPKFPMAHTLSFLLRRFDVSNNASLRDMVENTLLRMYRGGLWDHVGGGFTRYSTDRKWLVPHFEKMLYDNALLLSAYIDAYLVTGNIEYRRIAGEIITYIRRDMTDTRGGFYSAENADSEGEEGKFYVFSYSEFIDIVGAKHGELAAEYFGIEKAGNWEGKNIPHIAVDPEDWRQRHGHTEAEAASIIESVKRSLFSARAKRIHPSLDDKILTSWNGLMISSLARAGQAMNDDDVVTMARNAADFLLDTMIADNGTLLHRYRAGKAGIPAFLEDYAFFVWGLIDLYEATFDTRFLQEAVRLNTLMLQKFSDGNNGGLFMSADDAEELIVRGKDVYDGAIPSGNSAAAWNMLRLARLTGDVSLEDRAHRIAEAFGGQISENPSAYTLMLTMLDFAQGDGMEIVLSASDRKAVQPFVEELRERFLPRSVVLYHEEGSAGSSIRKLSPYVALSRPVNGKPAAYICRNFVCDLPVMTALDFSTHLGAR